LGRQGVGSRGRWVARALGARQGHPRVVDDEVTLPGLRYTARKPRSSTSRRYSRRRYRCPVGPAIAERWVARALGHQGVGWHGPPVGRWVARALGARQGRPRVQRLKGRWVALSPPVSRRPGSYPSPRPRRRPPPRRRPRPRRRRPQRGGNESPEPPPTHQTPRGVPTEP
jgi:hypothetical protein